MYICFYVVAVVALGFEIFNIRKDEAIESRMARVMYKWAVMFGIAALLNK